MDVSTLAPFANVECPKCGAQTRVKLEFGPYTLVRRHAIGGMSMVFAALDNTLGREVALKILSENFSVNERRIAAFEEEARITASFSHPNVVRVLRTGRAFGRFYIAMEFVPGGHFEQQIRERGKIPELEMLPLAIEVALGLKAAHAAGLIHRDVKPGNILLDAKGHAKLVDFGLALVTQGGKAKASELWATPYYVPPESVEGFPEDFRSDIYAFGATLYHALAGKPSCGEESMATEVLREAKKKVIPLSLRDPSISPETCRVVEKAMAYNPNARFNSYDELISNLTAVLGKLKTGRVDAADSAAIRRAEKKRKERSVMVARSAAVLALAVLCWACLWWLKRSKSKDMQRLPKTANPAKTVDSAPPVETGAHPAVADNSADIMKNYRDARAALAGKDFEKATGDFLMLFRNPAYLEPSRTLAGVEAVLADFLNGQAADAHNQARETAKHAKSLPQSTTRISEQLLSTLDELNQYPPLSPPPPDAPLHDVSRMLATMLAGLKNWEQGMPNPAAACFKAVVAAKLPPDDQWAVIYQQLAADYLTDYELLSGPLFSSEPADKEGCDAARRDLDKAFDNLKTRGRAKFDVNAWRLDLAKKASLIKPEKAR